MLDSFSAHADGNELVKYAMQFNQKILKKLFIVHGEKDGQETLKNQLEERNIKDISIPVMGERFKTY